MRPLSLYPVNIGEALAFANQYHSHHDPPISGLCAVGVANGGGLACVAILGRPVSRMLDANVYIAEVTRVASDKTEHAGSKALGAITRAGLDLGHRRLVSYTLLGEAGTIYRACGWWPAALVKGRNWGNAKRPREAAGQPGDKVRWEFGPDCISCEVGIKQLVDASVGKIAIPERKRRTARQTSMLEYFAMAANDAPEPDPWERTCNGCGTVMDQSDVCRHECAPTAQPGAGAEKERGR